MGHHIIERADEWSAPLPLSLAVVGVRVGRTLEKAKNVDILCRVNSIGWDTHRFDVIEDF
jgi:hypothetical protein